MSQRTKKPLPRTLEAWQREVNGIRRFLAGAKQYTKDNGKEWLDKMSDYYNLRLLDLNENRPVLKKRR